ncbi:MAG: crossover junction endodeoxyribonuclease RuvC [Acidobacteria bacterium]|nr:MAG: crossover junction endodeoxyribonuclease RuvC [Acidobacteriota bacterium]
MFAVTDSRVMGIDPGVSTTGYGVVERTSTGLSAVDYGVIKTPVEWPIETRLRCLFEEIERYLSEFVPGSLAIERVLFQANAKTAMSVGQATGAVLVAAARCDLPVTFYSPNEVKQAVAGYGAADKKQVTSMVAKVLELAKPPQPADAADALAIALTHANSSRLRSKLAEAGA